MAQRTPLYDRHLAAGATMVEFGGFLMPQQYTSIRDEHLAVRGACGLFDLSHMGEVRLRGAGAGASAQRLVTNDVSRLEDGHALYAPMCNDDGGIVDDVLVYRIAADDMLIVVNAACRDKDIPWIADHLEPGCSMVDESDDVALLAVQGPKAVELVASLSGDGEAVRKLPSFHSLEGTVAGVRARISRTGYTGEDGYELYVAAQDAGRLWDAVCESGVAAGLRACGLGARDTLRLEAGLRLYGQDMDETTDPYSAGLAWTVKLDKGAFIGRDSLLRLDPQHPPRRFAGLAFRDRVIPRHGQAVTVAGVDVGVVTSGTFSFTLGHGVATASLRGDVAPETGLEVLVRGTPQPAGRVRLPFYRRSI